MSVTVAAGSRIADLRRTLATALPKIASALPSCRLAVEERFVRDDAELHGDCEVAVIPPVSGG